MSSVAVKISTGFGSGVVLLFALVLAALFTVASYPGFMSFDSVEALRQAREGIEGSQYPPFGSYVWRVFDWIWPGPTLMQLFQNCTLLLSFAWILNNIGWPWLVRLLLLAAFAAFPPLAGTMLVVWKDVAVAAFYMLSFALMFSASRQEIGAKRGWFLAASVFFLFCGMAYRFNAASGALSILVYAIGLRQCNHGREIKFFRSLIFGFAGLLVLFSMVWLINSFRFPEFTRLEKNTNMMSIMRHDLVGISAFSGKSFLRENSGIPVAPEYLKKIYDARHLNITSANDTEKRISHDVSGLTRQWMAAIAEYPTAYIKHRFSVFSEYVGFHDHEIFYVTHPNVDQNKFGIVQSPNRLTPVFVNYVVSFDRSTVDRAWIYYLFGLLALASTFLQKGFRYRTEAAVALSSALLYLAPMFFITPAGDLRYNFWSLCGTLVSIVFVVAGYLDRFENRNKAPSAAKIA